MTAKAVPKKSAAENAESAKRGLDAITQLRVEEIAVTLREGTFRHGVTLKGFQAKWGLCYQRVGELSSYAAKKVRAEVTDTDQVAAVGFAAIKRIADEAMTGTDEKGNDCGHRKLALAAYDTWITKSGAAAPTKAVVGVTSDLALLSDEQLEARKAEVLARLAGKGGAGE